MGPRPSIDPVCHGQEAVPALSGPAHINLKGAIREESNCCIRPGLPDEWTGAWVRRTGHTLRLRPLRRRLRRLEAVAPPVPQLGEIGAARRGKQQQPDHLPPPDPGRGQICACRSGRGQRDQRSHRGRFPERRQRVAPDSAPAQGVFQPEERGLALPGRPDLGPDLPPVPGSQQRRHDVEHRQPGRPPSPGAPDLQARDRFLRGSRPRSDRGGGQAGPGQKRDSRRLGGGGAVPAGQGRN